MIWTVAKKELRGYFNSAVAVIFLAAFIGATLFAVFWHEQFFARGLADLRPLFEWMPKLLIILVSALAMRLWAEERRAGTLEVLLTLPIPRHKLVLGKFVAGMLLIAIALATTLGIPITVAMMGNLDWGPVVGGYLAALLLAAAYLVIGMCVSAATDIQIVAFVGTAGICIISYLLGGLGDIGRSIGTGARFESVARGVIDLRDLAYYASIVAVGIVLNVLLLGLLTWGRGERARQRRLSIIITLGLIIVNAIALALWLSPVRRARIDITQDGAYSLSSSTQKILGNLDERLLIRAYFSKKTHPLLEPLIPQLEDLLDEYRVAGEGKVRVEIIDPTDDDEARREAQERFEIKPDNLPFATQTEQTVVSAYFAIAIEYGDKHDVLRLRDLIQERSVDINKTEVTLKNPEYEITKSIKKAVTSFASVEALFAQMSGKAKLTAYITPKALPENWKDGDQKLKKIVDQVIKDTGGKLEYEMIEPPLPGPGERPTPMMIELAQKYGLEPFGILGIKSYYFHLILQVGDRTPVLLLPPDALSDNAIKTMLMDGIKRAAPGFTKVIGMWTPPGGPPMNMGGQMQEGVPPPQSFRKLREALEGNYEIRDVPLTGRVPDEIEALLVCGPTNLDAKAVEAIDQFVMRGGSLIVLAGRYRFAMGESLGLEKVNTGLEPLFATWGITQLDQMVMDTKAEVVPVPHQKTVRGEVIEDVVPLPFPFFVRVEGKRVASSVITSGIPGAVMHFASPVDAKEKIGDDTRVVEALLSSSSDSWLTSSTVVEPDLEHYTTGFAPGTDPHAQTLAISVVGGFASSQKKPAAPPAAGSGSGSGSGAPEPPRILEHSPPSTPTRVVVFGSSAFASDALYGLAQRFNWDLAVANLTLVQNAVDWALSDTDLLTIRARTASAHALTVEQDSREAWRIANVVIAAIALGIVILVVYLRKRAVKPIVQAEKEGCVMLTRLHKILLGALAVQILLVIIVRTRGGATAPLAEKPLVPGLDVAAVTSVKIYGDGEDKPKVELVKQGNDWVLASHWNYPAETSKVTDLLTPLGKMAAAEPIATSSSHHKQLHVGDKDFDRKLVITAGSNLVVYVGAAAGARRNAVRLDGSEDVYAVSGVSSYAINLQPRDWVKQNYYELQQDQIEKLTVQRGATTVEIAKAAPPPAGSGSGSGSGSATIVPPPPAASTAGWEVKVDGAPVTLAAGEKIDQGVIDDYLRDITSIPGIPADPKRDASQPTATITVTRKDGKVEKLDVVTDNDQFWVKLQGVERATLIPKNELDKIVLASRDRLVQKADAKPANPPPGPPPGMPGMPPDLPGDLQLPPP